LIVFLAGPDFAADQQSPSDEAGWYKLGKRQLYSREFEAARKSAERAIELAPQSARAYILLGETARELHDYDGAYRAWLAANKLDPSDSQSTYYLGRLFYEANTFSEAAAWLRETLRLAPGHFAAMTYLGLSAEALNLPATAGQLYRAAMNESKAQGKPYSWAWLSLAKLLRLQSDEQQAFAVLEEGERLCPSPQLLVVLGQVLSAKGNSSRAESVLRRAIEGDPSIAAAHYALARLLRTRGKLAESDREMDAFRRAKENEPQSPVLAIKAK
jgi:tetratricopeptide (TPR) repeat protein